MVVLGVVLNVYHLKKCREIFQRATNLDGVSDGVDGIHLAHHRVK